MTWKIGHDDCESQLRLPAVEAIGHRPSRARQARTTRPQSARKITPIARRPAEPMVAELMGKPCSPRRTCLQRQETHVSSHELTDFRNDDHEQAMSDHPHEAGQTRSCAACGDLGQDKKQRSGNPLEQHHVSPLTYTRTEPMGAENVDLRHEQAAAARQQQDDHVEDCR